MPLVPEFIRPAPLVRVAEPASLEIPRRRRGHTAEELKQFGRDARALLAQEDSPRAEARVERGAGAAPLPPANEVSSGRGRTGHADAPDDSHLAVAAALRDRPPLADHTSAADARRMHAEARFVCDTLRLFHLCPRASCRKARRCRGHSRLCLDMLGEHAPAEAHVWVEALIEAGKTGTSVDKLEAERAQEHLVFDSWIAGIAAGRG